MAGEHKREKEIASIVERIDEILRGLKFCTGAVIQIEIDPAGIPLITYRVEEVAASALVDNERHRRGKC